MFSDCCNCKFVYILCYFDLQLFFPPLTYQHVRGVYWNLPLWWWIYQFLPLLPICAWYIVEAISLHVQCLKLLYLLEELNLLTFSNSSIPNNAFVLKSTLPDINTVIIAFLVSIFMIYLSFTVNLCPSCFGYLLDGACIWIFKNPISQYFAFLTGEFYLLIFWHFSTVLIYCFYLLYFFLISSILLKIYMSLPSNKNLAFLHIPGVLLNLSKPHQVNISTQVFYTFNSDY